MGVDALLLRKAVVSGSGLIYWIGVLIQARRVRTQIGRSPNMTPRTAKERVLWLGWSLVIAVWVGQPFFVGGENVWVFVRLCPLLMRVAVMIFGLALVVAGYAGTLWCYAIMGSSWRIGVNEQEKNALVTGGPFARVRHPIYALQVVMLAGALCLLPTVCSLVLLAFHLLCVWLKAADEEAYLLATHGEAYRAHIVRTGRLFPKM
ncbi:MAG: isoprenylcysteine carboxylmethyltransferase family protein [Chthoniobacteraceae bacterium]